jgi:hypothetical protein
LKDICIGAAAVLMLLGTGQYVLKIRRGEIRPSLATWIMFALGSGLSLVSYLQVAHLDWKSGILNTIDTGAITAILIAIFTRGDHAVRLQRFEKIYLSVALLIVGVWAMMKSGLVPNLLLQGLMTWAYLPTIQKLLSARKNTESLSAWVMIFAASLCGLYPAIAGRQVLAVIYALRASGLVGITLVIIIRYELQAAKAHRNHRLFI